MDCSSVDILSSSRAGDLGSARGLSADVRMGFAADLNSNHRALQSNECAVVVDVAASGDKLFCALFGASCAIDIDLLRPFGGFGENTNLIRLDFDKSPGH